MEKRRWGVKRERERDETEIERQQQHRDYRKDSNGDGNEVETYDDR